MERRKERLANAKKYAESIVKFTPEIKEAFLKVSFSYFNDFFLHILTKYTPFISTITADLICVFTLFLLFTGIFRKIFIRVFIARFHEVP